MIGAAVRVLNQKRFNSLSNVIFKAPSESDVKGHYKTFIQEVSNTCRTFSDEGQPTREEKALGKCEMCPSFGFKSQSEKERHMRCSIVGKKPPM